MPHYSLVETCTPLKPSRYSANGKRISKERFDHIKLMADMYGKQDSFLVRKQELKSGGIKWKYYNCASW